MKGLIIEGGDYSIIIYIVMAIMVGPALLLAFVGFLIWRNNKKTAKIFYILAAVYLIISLGLCGSLMI